MGGSIDKSLDMGYDDPRNTMIKELKRYYQQQGISALGFDCTHFKHCREGYEEKFVKAKEAFVGTEYEKGRLPRLLFVSLDPGDSPRLGKHRTVDYVRLHEENDCRVAELLKNRHWYRTHELAWTLLQRIKPDLRIEDSHLYFAHTNSAKCCVNNDDKKAGPGVLFNNCREYLREEIIILKPDILVTQGDWAKHAIKEIFFKESCDLRSPAGNDLCSYVPFDMGKRKVIWFPTYHPGAYGLFNKQKKTCWEIWATIVHKTFK